MNKDNLIKYQKQLAAWAKEEQRKINSLAQYSNSELKRELRRRGRV